MSKLSAEQRHCLEKMGIVYWQSRDQNDLDEPQVDGVVEDHLTPATADTQALNRLDWQSLEESVKACQLCSLHKTRTQTVFGVGDTHANWLIIGEAPGADEDRQGEPFVGRAGKLLNAMLLALGLQRSQVYIANILKCRPPNNRDPLPEEVNHCESYLQKQIRLIQPKVILAVGRIAAQNLLKTNERIGALRGRKFFYGEQHVPVIVTYHPAYLLRSPKEKRKAWSDLLLAQETMEKELNGDIESANS